MRHNCLFSKICRLKTLVFLHLLVPGTTVCLSKYPSQWQASILLDFVMMRWLLTYHVADLGLVLTSRQAPTVARSSLLSVSRHPGGLLRRLSYKGGESRESSFTIIIASRKDVMASHAHSLRIMAWVRSGCKGTPPPVAALKTWYYAQAGQIFIVCSTVTSTRTTQ